MRDHLLRFRPRLGKTAGWHLHTGFVHRLLEQQAVFGNANRLALGANHFYATLFKHARIVECDCQIERGLTADSGQQRIWPFLANDGADGLHGERLDVGDIGRFRVRHDRRRIGIDQYDLVTLLPQRLACLRTGIVKLARLSNNDWAGSDD